MMLGQGGASVKVGEVLASHRHVVTLASSRTSAGSSAEPKTDRPGGAQQFRVATREVLAPSARRLPNKALQRTVIDKLPLRMPRTAAAERQR
jgi:hypothetical protein